MDRGGCRAAPVQLLGQIPRRRRGGSIVNEYARPGRMQRARDFGADAPCAAGDQDHLFSREGSIVAVMRESRYRIVRRSVYLVTPESCERSRRSRIRCAGARASRRRDRKLPVAGSASSATWISRCMRPDLVTTARVRQARARRRFHHRAGDLPAVRRLRGPAVRRSPLRAGQRTILEIGAGSGRLAADFCCGWRRSAACPRVT